MKRFTESAKWQDAWFTRLPLRWKMAWIYVLDNCDCAGVCQANPSLMAFHIGEAVDIAGFFAAAEGRIEDLGNDKWFVRGFVRFQYGERLNEKNSAHRGVLAKLRSANLRSPVPVDYLNEKAPAQPLPSTSAGAKDKDKEKDKDNAVATSLADSELLIAALAQVESSDPAQLPPKARVALRDALAEIQSVASDVTPDEIRRRAGAYRGKWPNCTLSASALARHWAKLDGGNPANRAFSNLSRPAKPIPSE